MIRKKVWRSLQPLRSRSEAEAGAGRRGRRGALPGVLLALVLGLSSPAAAGEIRVIVGIDAVAALVEELAGEEVRVLRLHGPGVNPRAPGEADEPLRDAAGALLYFRTGSWLEGGDEKRVSRAAGPGLAVVDLSEGIDLIAPSKPEETERKIFTAALGLDDASYPEEENPYFWLDPVLTARAVEIMAGALAQAFPRNMGMEARTLQLRQRLADLDGEIRGRLKSVSDKRLAAFSGVASYFARRYGIVEVPVTGVTPGGGPGRQSLKGTVSRIRSLGVPAVFTDPSFPRRPAESAAARAGVPLLTLHPFGTPEHGGYFDMMRHNLSIIERGLR